MESFVKKNIVRYRMEYWGGLAWTPNGPIYELNHDEIQTIALLEKPRSFDENTLITGFDYIGSINRLVEASIIEKTNLPPITIQVGEIIRLSEVVKESKLHLINKPFWVHIQPFTFCNQNCIHCYCSGGSKGSKFLLSIETWKKIIDKLYDFGILDVYITGGENLILEDSLDLTKYILSKGFGTGLSTNGMLVNEKVLHQIQQLDIDFIQVSLDSPIEETNDFIRGTKGAYRKTIMGIRRLRDHVSPIINMVVNNLNITQIEDMIKLGVSEQVKEYKFFPQKLVGRGKTVPNLLVSWDQWKEVPFQEYQKKYKVNIDYLKNDSFCGAGTCGFAINETGDIYPCIFGIENVNQRIGNVLTEDINHLWFESSLTQFRCKSSQQPCSRCEC